MGSWSMHIHGHGIHDNGLAEDADSLLRKFVAELRGLGHVVHGAHITAGASQDLTAGVPAEHVAVTVTSGTPGPIQAAQPAAPPADAPPADPAS